MFVRRVIQAVERLTEFPRSGRVVPELADDALREVVFHSYRIVYEVDTDTLIVLGWCTQR